MHDYILTYSRLFWSTLGAQFQHLQYPHCTMEAGMIWERSGHQSAVHFNTPCLLITCPPVIWSKQPDPKSMTVMGIPMRTQCLTKWQWRWSKWSDPNISWLFKHIPIQLSADSQGTLRSLSGMEVTGPLVSGSVHWRWHGEMDTAFSWPLTAFWLGDDCYTCPHHCQHVMYQALS